MLLQGVYVTYVYEGGPAHQSGLQVHDKLLQVTFDHIRSPLPILSMSGVDRHDCISPRFCVLFELCIQLISFISPHTHLSLGLPEVSLLRPSSLLLALQRSCLLFSLHGHAKKGVSE